MMTRIMLRSFVLMVLVHYVGAVLHAQTVVLRDDMSGSNFRILSTGDLTPPNTDPNIDVRFGFNYATGNVGENAIGGPYPASIPEAPNTQPGDAPRTGLYIAANIADTAVSAVAALPLDAGNPSGLFEVSGNYSIQVDVWLNFERGVGSATEFGGLYVGHDQTAPQRGAGFLTTSDGDAAQDYRLFKDAGHQFVASGQYNPAILAAWQADAQYNNNNDHATNNVNDFFQTAFPENDIGVALDPDDGQGNQQIGTYPNPGGGILGFRWATITIDVRPNDIGSGLNSNPGIATVKLQATWETGDPLDPNDRTQVTSSELLIGTIDNSNLGTVVNMTGPVAVVYADLFTSLNTSGFNFGIFDNLIVTIEDSAAIDGDHNGDGTVDAADYVLWRSNPGAYGGDPGGYNAWRANFGQGSPGAGGGSLARVPEPAAATLCLLGLIASLAVRRASR